MPRLRSRVALCLALPLAVAASGCRFGFDPLSFNDRDEQSGSATGVDNEAGDAPDASPSDLTPDGLDAATVGTNEDASTPVGPGSANDAGAPSPVGDAATPGVDAAIPPPPTTLAPFPTNIDCTSFTGLIACDNFSGSRSGENVRSGTFNGSTVLNQYFTGNVPGDMASANLSTQFNSLTDGSVFLRFSLFMPGGFGIQGLNIASIGNVTTGTDFGVDLNVLRNGEVEIKTSGDGAVNRADGYVLPRNRWLCVLLKVDTIANTGGSVRVLIDNEEIIAANDIDTEPAGGVTGASAGIDWSFNLQEPASIHVDNFVVTREHPSNCP